MKIAVRDLKPNPFRDLERYPVQQDKIDALKQSIKTTTFWDNLIARKSPNGSGGFEIAYGHNRLKALRELRVESIDIPVRDLDDTAMARIMAHENMEEWGHSTVIEQETVRAIVSAYAEGRIELPKPRRDSTRHGAPIRYAPSFSARAENEKTDAPYTAETLCEFLGWKPYKVEATLAALALVEDGLATDQQFKGLTTRQAEAVATETRFALKETKDPALAKAVGKRIAAGMRQSVRGHDRAGAERDVRDVTIHNARQKTREMIQRVTPSAKPKPIPNINQFAEDLARAVADVISPNLEQKLKSLIQYRDEEDLKASNRRGVVTALRSKANYLNKLADRLES